uniref:DUF4283 domain-containing protein n=1 Tax=Setaria viridis TaxID=4556 RepID=A0A4U6VAP5_SETVI|nr:hypothetical protein SEVIR_4G190800v2 [Setaria viridis]
MAATGRSGTRPGPAGSGNGDGVAEILERLNLTRHEEVVAAFSDDEEEITRGDAEWAIIGKVLSPSVLHITTIRSAMKSALGNPFGLKMRSVGDKPENLFIAEFGGLQDKNRALDGSPWMLWVRILNLPFGWMNEKRGLRAAALIGDVIKLDVDEDGKATGAFLRARVAVEIDTLRRLG